MRFFLTNSVDDKGYEVGPGEVANRFWASDTARRWMQTGGLLERALVVWMSAELGGWDPTAEDHTKQYGDVLDAVFERRPVG